MFLILADDRRGRASAKVLGAVVISPRRARQHTTMDVHGAECGAATRNQPGCLKHLSRKSRTHFVEQLAPLLLHAAERFD